MKQKLLQIITLITLLIVPVLATPATASAAGCGNSNSSKGQVLQGVGETGSNCDPKGVTNAISTAVEILSYIVGVAAIIMIIVSGLRYLLSGGDSGKVSAAKNSLIY